MDRTVLVTGGTGYVAGWCVAELIRRGYRVRATVRDVKRAQPVRDAVSSVVDPVDLADPADPVDLADRLSFVVADLTSDDGWDAAVAGVDFVLHVAAPLGDAARTADELIIAARDGAIRVLRAATRADVRRVVMTSAANAASPSSYTDEGVTDETLWTDPADPTLIPYRRAKTLAERAAWDFMAHYEGPTTLTTILPGAVFGPILRPDHLGTTQIIARMLNGGMRRVPRIAFEIVDVRDLADVHIRAMTSPAAAGERFLATGELMWMREIALTLRSALGPAAAKVPTRQAPDFAVRFAAQVLDRSLRSVVPALGRRNRHSIDKARRLLGWQPRPAAETVVACARGLLAAGASPAA